MIVTCPACGNAAEEGAESCFICGAALAAGAPPAGEPAGGEEPAGGGAGQQNAGGATAGWSAYGAGCPTGAAPWPYGAQQAYGSPQALSPWYPSYPPYGYGWPYVGPWWPYFAPFFSYPCPSPFMAYPGAYAGYPAGQQYPYAAPYSAPGGRRRMRALYIALIILGSLVVIGGGVAAAVLLTGNSNATFRLGDGQVAGADIEFNDMVIKQEEGILLLTGTYDNGTKYEGDVVVTVQAVSGGVERLVSFTVPVEPGTGRAFTQQKPAGSIKLGGATLSSLVFKVSTKTDTNDQGSYPFDSETTQPDSSGQTTQPVLPDDLFPPDGEMLFND